jgi:hypothetical protein
LSGHHQALLGRYDVLDWGDSCVIYDRSLFLTHLLDPGTAAVLRARLATGEAAHAPEQLQALLDQLLPLQGTAQGQA